MGRLRLKLDEAQDNTAKATPPRFAPAGQSTQMIVGADGASDQQILGAADNLYGNYRMPCGRWTCTSAKANSSPSPAS